MNEHPIEGLMTTAMDSIKDMVDVNTIVGEPIETSNNIIIIPISKVGFGFASGGSEFKGETIDEYSKKEKEEAIQYRLPFGGGSGAGVSISPVAFLVVQSNTVKLLPVEHNSCFDKLLDYVPDLMEKVNSYLNKNMQNKKEEKKEEDRRKERQQKELKQTMEELNTNTAQNVVNKTKPRRNRIPKEPITYEYEYDETEPEDMEEQ
ncbi:MAG: GerW family sporulation protein [Clostridia bacterium]|nr:GerW family sporulation protein [Clostridia bacterium]